MFMGIDLTPSLSFLADCWDSSQQFPVFFSTGARIRSPPLIPIFSSRPHLLSSLVLFSLLSSLFLYLFFFYDSCMYFSWLADFLTTLLPSRYQSPVCSSSRSSNRLWGWALTPSCSTWKISCCQYCGWLAGINPLDADWILGMRLCTTTV